MRIPPICIKEANDAKVPVFTADIACLAPGPKVVSHIATDNFGGGKEAAKAMIEALGEGGGKIVILDFKPAESCILRVKGFKEAMEAHNMDRAAGKIVIVAELPGDGRKDKGYKAAEDALQAHPDIVGIFAINDPSALGARAALEKAGKADQIKLIGFDAQPEGIRAPKRETRFNQPVLAATTSAPPIGRPWTRVAAVVAIWVAMSAVVSWIQFAWLGYPVGDDITGFNKDAHTNGTLKRHLSMWLASSAGVSTSDSSM